MILVDSFSTNGNLKKTCQDYSISDFDPIPYAIISDGCSSSRFTDVGARILAHCAKSTLLNNSNILQYPELDNNFRDLIVANIQNIYKFLDLPSECMDATLILSSIQDDRIKTFFFGDGVRLIINKDGSYELSEISYKGNAPYYLSYLMSGNEGKNKAFYDYQMTDEDKNGLTKMVKNKSSLLSLGIANQLKYDTFAFDNLPIKDMKFYLIMSDGAESFLNINNGERIPLGEIVEEFSSFKNTNGEFIKRRVRRALDELNKQGIHNTDDISVAGFYFSD